MESRHELSPKSVRVEKLFQQPDLDEDAFEVIHDQLHIFRNQSGKFFTLHASIVEVHEMEWGSAKSPWNVFTEREKRARELAGLTRPVSYELILK